LSVLASIIGTFAGGVVDLSAARCGAIPALLLGFFFFPSSVEAEACGAELPLPIFIGIFDVFLFPKVNR
jgi:hypothetical protein